MKDFDSRVVGLIELDSSVKTLSAPKAGLTGRRVSKRSLPLRSARPRLKVFDPADELPAEVRSEATFLLHEQGRRRILSEAPAGSTTMIEADLVQLREDLTRELRLLERRLAKLLEAEGR